MSHQNEIYRHPRCLRYRAIKKVNLSFFQIDMSLSGWHSTLLRSQVHFLFYSRRGHGRLEFLANVNDNLTSKSQGIFVTNINYRNAIYHYLRNTLRTSNYFIKIKTINYRHKRISEYHLVSDLSFHTSISIATLNQYGNNSSLALKKFKWP